MKKESYLTELNECLAKLAECEKRKELKLDGRTLTEDVEEVIRKAAARVYEAKTETDKAAIMEHIKYDAPKVYAVAFEVAWLLLQNSKKWRI